MIEQRVEFLPLEYSSSSASLTTIPWLDCYIHWLIHCGTLNIQATRTEGRLCENLSRVLLASLSSFIFSDHSNDLSNRLKASPYLISLYRHIVQQ